MNNTLYIVRGIPGSGKSTLAKTMVKGDMILEYPKIVVSNTFTQEWEMQPYIDMAKDNGYKVFTIVVENRHGGKNEHNVPDEIIDKMKGRFEIVL